MSPSLRPDEIMDQILALVRAYALRRFGQVPRSITLNMPDGDGHTEKVPLGPLLQLATPLPSSPSPGSTWASGPEPKHLSDFRRVYWPGLGVFTFTAKQAAVVRLLWEARFADGAATADVDQPTLLRAAESDGARVYDLFKRHPAWQALIVNGEQAGTYRLPEVPGADGEMDEAG